MRADELQRISLGYMKETGKSKKMTRLNEKIEKATKRFKKTRNVKLFLKQVTFQENLGSYFDQRTKYDVNDSDADEDDDIIPNDFNENCNFSKSISGFTNEILVVQHLSKIYNLIPPQHSLYE